MILGFRVDRGLFGEVNLHGFHETDKATALESVGMRMGWEDERTGRSRTSLLRCQF